MSIRNKPDILIAALLGVFLCISAPAAAQQDKPGKTVDKGARLTLSQAVICEGIKEYAPENEAVVFPIVIGKVYCFSFFDPVPEKTVIYHNWYFKDKLTARLKLTLKPPHWRTYSTIQLREADRGPWRVEITGPKGRTFQILRFSITD